MAGGGGGGESTTTQQQTPAQIALAEIQLQQQTQNSGISNLASNILLGGDLPGGGISTSPVAATAPNVFFPKGRPASIDVNTGGGGTGINAGNITPPPVFGGDRVAGFNNTQRQGQRDATSLANSINPSANVDQILERAISGGAIDPALGQALTLALQGQGLGSLDEQQSFARVGGLQTDPRLTEAMDFGLNGILEQGNPFTQGAINNAIDPVTSNLLETILPNIGSAAQQSGAFGGARQGFLEAQALDNHEQNVGNLAAGISFEAFNRSLGTFDNALNAGTTQRGQDVAVRGQDVTQRGQDTTLAGITRGQDVQARGQDAGLIETGLGTATDIRGQDEDTFARIAALTPSLEASRFLPSDVLNQIGGAQQQQEQNELTNNQNVFEERRDAPINAVRDLAAISAGLNSGTAGITSGGGSSSTDSEVPVNVAGNTLGGAAAGAWAGAQMGSGMGPWGAAAGALAGFLLS